MPYIIAYGIYMYICSFTISYVVLPSQRYCLLCLVKKDCIKNLSGSHQDPFDRFVSGSCEETQLDPIRILSGIKWDQL